MDSFKLAMQEIVDKIESEIDEVKVKAATQQLTKYEQLEIERCDRHLTTVKKLDDFAFFSLEDQQDLKRSMRNLESIVKEVQNDTRLLESTIKDL